MRQLNEKKIKIILAKENAPLMLNEPEIPSSEFFSQDRLTAKRLRNKKRLANLVCKRKSKDWQQP